MHTRVRPGAGGRDGTHVPGISAPMRNPAMVRRGRGGRSNSQAASSGEAEEPRPPVAVRESTESVESAVEIE